MFRNVMVGVDGRAQGRDAITLAQKLVAPDGELTLANVFELNARGAYGHAFSDTERDAELELLRREREATGVDADLATTAATSVGPGLHELAARHGADLLVIGSCHRSTVGQVLLGDEMVASLLQAPCAVAVATSGYADSDHAIGRIGVGGDGTQIAAEALAVARDLAAQHAAVLRALEATPREPELVALNDRVDLLIAGRADGLMRRLVQGDTAKYLARHTHCPVVVP